MTNAIIVTSAANAAYIFGRNSSGNWTRRQKLLPANPDVSEFGTAVAVNRGMILVGAPGTITSENAIGTVHGFTPGAKRYEETLVLSAPDSITRFGYALAMFGDYVAVGGTEFITDPEFQRPVAVWTYSRIGSTVQLLGQTGFGPGKFPASIAIANNLLLVGSPYDDVCVFFDLPCVGRADFFQLNRFQQ